MKQAKSSACNYNFTERVWTFQGGEIARWLLFGRDYNMWHDMYIYSSEIYFNIILIFSIYSPS